MSWIIPAKLFNIRRQNRGVELDQGPKSCFPKFFIKPGERERIKTIFSTKQQNKFFKIFCKFKIILEGDLRDSRSLHDMVSEAIPSRKLRKRRFGYKPLSMCQQQWAVIPWPQVMQQLQYFQHIFTFHC